MVDVAMMEKKEGAGYQPTGEVQRATLCLYSTDKRSINKTAKEFYEMALEFDPSLAEPVILPIEEACLTTRKSPCGNGTATFSRVKLRVYKRRFEVSTDKESFAKLIEFLKNSPVDTDIKMNS